MEIKESLTKRVGPLPVWGWGAVVIGGVGVFLILRRRTRAASSTAEDMGSSTGLGGGGGGGFGGGGGGGGSSGGGGGGASPVPPAGDHTNPTPIAPVSQAPTAAPTLRLSAADEQAIVQHRATSEIGAQVIANNIAGTVDFVSRQVQRAGDTGISYNYGAVGATPSQIAGQREQIATALRDRGYVASTWGGQVYAGRNSTAFFNALPQDAQAALLRLIAARKQAA